MSHRSFLATAPFALALTPLGQEADVPPVLEGKELFVEEARVLHTLVGEAAGDEFGWVARAVGDLDEDGVIDFAATAPSHSTSGEAGGASGGKVYVYSSREGTLLFAREGRAGERLGNGVDGAGDVNGDGVLDVIAGAPGTGTGPGTAYVFSGRDGSTLLELAGSEASDRFGLKVCGLGDLDGDGRSEVAVGAPGAGRLADSTAAAGVGAGRVTIFSGSSGEELLRIEGEDAAGQLGSALDGTSDGSGLVVVGAMTGGPHGTGRATVYDIEKGQAHLAFAINGDEQGGALGQYFVSVLGDVDDDGIPDIYASDWGHSGPAPFAGRIYVHSGADGERLLQLDGVQPGEGFGTSPSVAGDANGDGAADLIIGAWQHRSGAPSGGKVTLFSGRDGTELAAWTCKQPGDTFGFDAVGLGDVDGDGGIDYLLTSGWSPAKGPRTGRVFVVAGPRFTAPRSDGE